MFGIMGDPPNRAGTLMPPATTRRLPEQPVTFAKDARIAPPYIPSGSSPRVAPAETEVAVEPTPDVVAPLLATEPDEPLFTTDEPAEIDFAEPDEVDVVAYEAIDAWEEAPDLDQDQDLDLELDDDEGVVEPAFEMAADEVLLELTQDADEAGRKEEFPLDAFIVPEQAQHVPSGLEGTAATPPPPPSATVSLAERLEKLSHRLRVEESDAVVRRLASGDRLDALLAGLLAGYLAGKSEQQ